MGDLPTFMGLSMIDLISIVTGLATLLVMVAVYRTALEKDPVKGRLKSLEERRDSLRAGLIRTNRRQSPIKTVDSVDLMRRLAEKFKLLQTEQTEKVKTKLAQAGFRNKDAVVVFQVGRLVSPFLMGILGIVLFYGFNIMPDKADLHPVMTGGMVLLGFKIPDIYISNVKTKRTDLIRKSLPDAMDLMVVCTEAGLTLDAAMSRVSRELGKASPELAEEFELTSIELGFLPDRRVALLNLVERVDLESLRALVAALIQSERYGTPLASALRELSSEFRNERMLKAEEKAARLPAILTVPMILFILPVLFIVLLGPAACKLSTGLKDIN